MLEAVAVLVMVLGSVYLIWRCQPTEAERREAWHEAWGRLEVYDAA
jgi:hypothetical protein